MPMTKRPSLSRRRFIAITASAAGAGLVGGPVATAGAPYRWRGIALGAESEILLYHPDRHIAETAIGDALDEVSRLEAVFSLYRSDSALSRLNRQGRLTAPAPELVDLLLRARAFGDATDGAFDVTVQPLWDLYAAHFSDRDAVVGPAADDLRRAMEMIDYRAIRVSRGEIRFDRPGMAVTLNGIAQGFITDRVSGVLNRHGFTDVLVNMGEIRGSGRRPDGAPWRIGLQASAAQNDSGRKIDLVDGAIATSAGHGFVFDPSGRHHHLIDPRSGESPHRWRSVSVIADTATTADALSTAFSCMERSAIDRVADTFGIRQIILA
jgi:FAD:protein FMN transferase